MAHAVLTEGARAPRRRGRRRLWRRRLRLLVPLAILAAAAVAVVLIVRAGPGRAERQLVTHYVHDWASGDYAGMYSLLDPVSKQHTSEARFAAAYQHDA
ncbi:MAG: hypothetical protein WAL38_22345, partial [Solirubrobacteraceae bacterium]